MQAAPHPLPPERETPRARALADLTVLLASATFALAWGAADVAAHDSAYYLNAAEHVARGDGFVTSSVSLGNPAPHEAISVFAPLFSTCVGLLAWLGVPARSALSAWVALSFVGYALVTRRLFVLAFPRGFTLATVLATLALVAQPSLRTAVDMALTDLFAATLCLAAALWALRGARSGAQQMALGTLLGLTVLARWASLNFVLPLCLWLLHDQGPHVHLRARAHTVLRVGTPIALLVGAAWLRNWLLTGTAMGERVLVRGDFVHQLGLAAEGAAHWFTRAHANLPQLRVLPTLHALTVLTLGVALGAAALTGRSRTARAALFLCASYGALMVASSASVAYDPISETRFWLLVHPLLAVGLLRALITVRWPALPKRALSLAWAAVAVHASVVFAGELSRELPHARAEAGFFSPRISASPVLARAIELHDAGHCQLATSDAVTVLPLSGTRPLKVLGEKELGQLARVGSRSRLCLLLIRDATMAWSLEGEYERVYQAVLRLAGPMSMHRAQRDHVAELWLPQALAPTSLAMP